MDERVKKLNSAQRELVVRFSNELLAGGSVVVFTQRLMMTNCSDPEIARDFASQIIELEKRTTKHDQ